MERPSKVEVPRPISSRMTKTALGRVVDDVRRFVHLHHEGRLAAREIVVRADPGENAIDQADLRARRRDEAADLRHQDDQRHLPDVGRFPGHVWSGDDGQAELFAIELGVVRHKFFFGQILIEHRMAPVLDDEPERIVEFRPAIMKQPRGFGQRAEHIERRNRGRRLLNRLELTQGFVAQFLEKLVLEVLGALVRAENFCFHFLQLRRDEALAADSGLLARVMRRARSRGSIS